MYVVKYNKGKNRKSFNSIDPCFDLELILDRWAESGILDTE